MPTVLVTGAAGFIGYHLAQRLAARGDNVIGIDNVNDYYDVRLKEARLEQLTAHSNFRFLKVDVADNEALASVFKTRKPESVVHLAAQAGVRYSLTHPHVYGASNLTGFLNVLEHCRHGNVRHLVYASSSSVYGANTEMPFSVHHNVDHPISLYAATKKANELMAHSYSHLYGMPTTGLRFFTVYGPWGRPDMAIYIFTAAILAGRPIEVFNQGQMLRDFTYIDDIIEGVVRTLDNTALPNPAWDSTAPDPATSRAPYRVYNIGNHRPVKLMYVIELLEGLLGKKATLHLVGPQPGDVPATYADVEDLARDVGFTPSTPIEEGLKQFVEWYREYNRS
jgi:UDP-glucuronate 4-epimerase